MELKGSKESQKAHDHFLETGWQVFCNDPSHFGTSWGKCYKTSVEAYAARTAHDNAKHGTVETAGSVQGSCRKPTGDFGD
ncbi:hypothetical protein [Paenibacillus sp. 2003]|uniref:hypothetical protein n=1 Tax=Paenibacillus sp. 2003 TaxID=2817761 RepID=UPI00285B3670|nr:hypothetical protein [Paenibacillus sp. 2003]MDR6717399.1 hypothetical protein [Paenibacillus sp. 2003]